MPRKPKKPKRMYAGIEAVWTASTWAWRARTMVLGKIHIGSCRDDQRLAHEDYLAIRKRLGRVHRVEDVSALGPALEAVLQRAKARRDPSHVEQDTGGAVRFILTVFREDAPLEGFDDQAFDFFVTRCLEQGRHPDTVRRYVRILNQALRLRGLPTVPALIPRAPRTPMEFFEPHELAEVIGQIEDERTRAIVQFIAMTGIRGGEFCRLRLSDIDTKRGVIRVVAKDRSNPRLIPITDALRPVVDVLLEHAVEGRLISSVDAWRSMFRRLSKSLGVTINGRKLRHSFVTSALYAGLPVAEARDLAGHRNLATTDRYAHAISSRLHDAASRVHKFQDRARDSRGRASESPADATPG